MNLSNYVTISQMWLLCPRVALAKDGPYPPPIVVKGHVAVGPQRMGGCLLPASRRPASGWWRSVQGLWHSREHAAAPFSTSRSVPVR
jgi:hypothetical protein